MSTAPKRTRIAVDVPPLLRKKLRIAAARREVTVREYVRRALERQLAAEMPDALHAADDRVLADLWDNLADGVYDRD